MKPIISKESFIEIVNIIQLQHVKDNTFADFMESYLDGRFVPMMNDHINIAVEKLMNICFNDTINDEYGYTWFSWFMYENDFGKSTTCNIVKLNEISYIIDSPEAFYDFMVRFMDQ